MIIKCKMCGGDLIIQERNPICECEYCGTKQTIPQTDNEKKGNLFNRANRLRMGAEFDKASAVYTAIAAEFPEEAEAYWGLCLCKYGIEYVDDPLTGNKIPTCHRTIPESIMDDEDFDQACENASPEAKRLYREEAKAIDRLQRNILSIVANEEPYDVFICYKETDENGERTEDSVLAQNIYDELVSKDLKVFFARISLEDKLGQEYEPYIYAALHSAKVMLSIGTRYEYFDAVWVKNEWARFLELMKTDRTKTLIPCYKCIDAYDMPREFKNLQGQDMGKLGWMQDLTRGILKICQKDGYQARSAVYAQQSADPTITGLLRRAMVFIEDKQWDDARQYSDRVLDLDVENGQAYLVKLMADLNISAEAELKEAAAPFDDNANYKKIIRFANEDLKSRIEEYASIVRIRKETLNRKIAEINVNYGAAEREYEQKIIEFKKPLQKIQQQIRNLRETIWTLQRRKESMIGLFDGKKRKEVEAKLVSLQLQIESLEQEEKRMPSAEEILPPNKTEYYYQLASAYLEAKKYQDAYNYFKQIKGYADVSKKLRELSVFIPNTDFIADENYHSIITALGQCQRAQDMILKLNETTLSHDSAEYKKIMEVLRLRADFERLYGVNHNDTMAALKKLELV